MILEIEDRELSRIYSEFVETKITTGLDISSSYFAILCAELRHGLHNKTLDDIDWDLIRHSSSDSSNREAERFHLQIWFDFLFFLIEKGYYNKPDRDVLWRQRNHLIAFSVSSSNKKNELCAEKWFTPFSVMKIPRMLKKDGTTKSDRYLYLPNADARLFDFIKKYYEDRLNAGLDLGDKQTALMFQTIYADYDGKGSCLDDFCDESFELGYAAIKNAFSDREKVGKYDIWSIMLAEFINYYLYVQRSMEESEMKEKFRRYNPTTLKYTRLRKCIEDGFQILPYSIYDPAPNFDKVALIIHAEAESGATPSDTLELFDVSGIKHPVLRQWAMECFWFDTGNAIQDRSKDYAPIVDFLADVSNRVSPNETVITFIYEDVIRFRKKVLTSGTGDATAARKLSLVKKFLEYVEERRYTSVDPALVRALRYKDSADNYDKKEAYTKEELNKLLSAYKNYAEKNRETPRFVLYMLYFLALSIFHITEMRLSSILALRIDSLKVTMSAKRQSEYKVVVAAKSAKDTFAEYNITYYVKTLIDEVSALTKELRQKAGEYERNYLFIYEREGHRQIARIRQDAFTEHHHRICQEYGIRDLTLGAIRNSYMQEVSDYVEEEGIDTSIVPELSRHSLSVHNRYYDKVDIRKFCEQFYFVQIGDIHISGTVTSDERDEQYSNRQVVMNGCGHCSFEKCDKTGMLDCLMCKRFVTTPKEIPFFEEAIKELDEQILNQKIQHEKEFLITKKRLYVAYLTELMVLEDKSD